MNRADATLDALMALTGANSASHRLRIMPGTGPLVFQFAARARGLELGVSAKSGESAPQLLVVRQLDVDEFDAA